MTQHFSRLILGFSVAFGLGVYACSGPNDPPRVLTARVGSSSAGAGPIDDGGGGSAGGMSFSPLCSDEPATAAGMAPTKGGACTATDSQLCYKFCGPKSVGYKSETCTSGLYVEQSGCSFPPGDYSCYKVPPAVDASCPTTVPQAGQACDVADCTLCNVGGRYFDSSGNSKQGYCVCPLSNDDAGARKWSCASSTAWPCPGHQGCI